MQNFLVKSTKSADCILFFSSSFISLHFRRVLLWQHWALELNTQMLKNALRRILQNPLVLMSNLAPGDWFPWRRFHSRPYSCSSNFQCAQPRFQYPKTGSGEHCPARLCGRAYRGQKTDTNYFSAHTKTAQTATKIAQMPRTIAENPKILTQPWINQTLWILALYR